jgi:hypothetical protein
MEKLLKIQTIFLTSILLFSSPLFAEDIEPITKADVAASTNPETPQQTQNDIPNAASPKPDVYTPFIYYPNNPFHIDLGLMIGNTNIDRSGTLSGSLISPNIHESINQSDQQMGVQLKFLFGADSKIQPFVFASLLSELNNSNTLFSGALGPFAGKSTVSLQSNWIARVGLGLQSMPLTPYQIRVGAGIGGAIIPQEILVNINEDVLTTPDQTTQNNLVPSLMASVGMNLCDKCFVGLPLTLTGQVIADHDASISLQSITPLGNTYNFSVNSRWQFNEYVIFGVHY